MYDNSSVCDIETAFSLDSKRKIKNIIENLKRQPNPICKKLTKRVEKTDNAYNLCMGLLVLLLTSIAIIIVIACCSFLKLLCQSIVGSLIVFAFIVGFLALFVVVAWVVKEVRKSD